MSQIVHTTFSHSGMRADPGDMRRVLYELRVLCSQFSPLRSCLASQELAKSHSRSAAEARGLLVGRERPGSGSAEVERF